MSPIRNPISDHHGQLILWNDPARFKVTIAGRRWGKTTYVKEKLTKLSCTPRAVGWYVAPTRADAKQILWEQLKENFYNYGWIKHRHQIHETDLTIERLNKSIIQLKSAQKPRSFRGRGVDYAALDEPAEYDYPEVWSQAIRPALSDKRGQADFVGTPKGMNWVYDLYNQAKTLPNWSAHQFKTIDSPFFQTPEGKQELEDARRNLTERDFLQEYCASFENFAGRLYYAFDRGACDSDADYTPDLPAIIGMDFNRSPMSACVFQKHGSTLHQVAEIFLMSSNTDEVCSVIKSRFPSQQVIVRPDATGQRKTSNAQHSDIEIIRRHGFRVEVGATNPNRVDRWASVNRAFEKGFVKVNSKQCPKTVRDLEVICYKEGASEPDLKDPMLGHLADAHGYAVHREFPILGKVTQGRWA